MKNVAYVINSCLETVKVIHQFHLMTFHYGTHVALGEFYEKFQAKTDHLAEVLLSKVNKQEESLFLAEDGEINTESAIFALREIESTLIDFRNSETTDASHTDVQSIIDEMLGLINQTIYMLNLN